MTAFDVLDLQHPGTALAAIARALRGFTQVEVTQVEGDPFNNYYVASRR